MFTRRLARDVFEVVPFDLLHDGDQAGGGECARVESRRTRAVGGVGGDDIVVVISILGDVDFAFRGVARIIGR